MLSCCSHFIQVLRSKLYVLAFSLIWVCFAWQSSHAMSVNEEIVTMASWPQYENGSTVSQLPSVRSVLKQFDENNRIELIIRHPGGGEGSDWARRLHDWLVSFGIPSQYIDLQTGSGAADQLVIVLIDRS